MLFTDGEFEPPTVLIEMYAIAAQKPGTQPTYTESREPTSGLEPLTCSLRVSSHTFTAVSSCFRNSLHKPC